LADPLILPKNPYMKNTCLLLAYLLLGTVLVSCSKNGGTMNAVNSYSSISLSVNDSTISFPISKAYIQDVLNLSTTLVVGQYADTSAKMGNINIRVIGDTTGRYANDSLLVSYTGKNGLLYNKTNDSSNFVLINKFPKTPNGMVTGSFSVRVANGTDTLKLGNGSFSAIYQY
jgi:hypothetical protein